jgi:hypothetical protein
MQFLPVLRYPAKEFSILELLHSDTQQNLLKDNKGLLEENIINFEGFWWCGLESRVSAKAHVMAVN